MKRFFAFLAVASAAILLGSCAKEHFNDEVPSGSTKLVLSMPGAKTYLGELKEGKRPLYWSTGDSIAVNGVVSEPLEKGDTSVAEFTFKGILSTPYKIAYPASLWTSETTVTLPKVAKYIPLIGYKSESGSASVNYVTSVMHFKIKKGTADSCKIAYVEVSAEGVQMSGVFNADFEKGTISSSESPVENNSVRSTVNAFLSDEVTDVFIPVPIGTYAAKVKIVDAKGHYMEQAISSREFTAGKIFSFPELAFNPTGTLIDVNIKTAADWNAFATNFNDGKYSDVTPLVVSIDADLDFTDVTPVSVGSYVGDTYCSATILGNNHIISNFSSEEPLIGCINTYGSLLDLTFDNTCKFAPDYANSVKSVFGPFTDYLKGEIKNCVNKGAITINAPSTGAINANKYCGGIAGRIREGRMVDCKNFGAISSAVGFTTQTDSKGKGKYTLTIGGLVGWISNEEGVVNGCENHGAITHNATAEPIVAGGIAGKCGGTIRNCTNDAAFSVTTTRATNDPCKDIIIGGIAGDANGVSAGIDNCSNSGSITSDSNVKIQYIGGIIGKLTLIKTLGTNNNNSGDITANKNGRIYYFGGLIGSVDTTLTYTFSGTPATGKIIVNGMEASTASHLYLGGLIGRTSVPITIQGDGTLDSKCDILLNATTAAKTAAFAGIGGVLGGSATDAPTIINCDVTGTTGISVAANTTYAITFTPGGIGGIIGQSSAGAIIRNCNVGIPIKFTAASKKISAASPQKIEVGGIAGCLSGGDSEISECSVANNGISNNHYNNNALTDTTGNTTGGIIGSFGHVKNNTYKITISQCSNADDVYAYRCCAGCIAGYLDGATVTDCSSNGALKNGNFAGGIVGYASNSSFTSCTFNNADGIVSTNAGSCKNYAGGLAGQTVKSSFTNCSTYFGTTNGVKAAGAIDAGNAPGSLIGYSDASTTITTCKAGGKLQSTNYGMPGAASTKSATLDATTVVSYAVGNLGFTPTSANVTLWDGK